MTTPFTLVKNVWQRVRPSRRQQIAALNCDDLREAPPAYLCSRNTIQQDSGAIAATADVETTPDPEFVELMAKLSRLEAKLASLEERAREREADLERLQTRRDEKVESLHISHLLSKWKHDFLYLPAGRHLIQPMEGGDAGGYADVLITSATATTLERQRRVIRSFGGMPYFDFSHDRKSEAFWPLCFYWVNNGDQPGVRVMGVFSSDGLTRVIERQEFKAFSPIVYLDRSSTSPHTVTWNIDAVNPNANLGGFVRSVRDAAYGEKLKLRLHVIT